MDALSNVACLSGVADGAVDHGGMFGMWIAFDIGVTVGAVQNSVDTGFLLRFVYVKAMPRLVLQALLVMTGKAFGILLRTNHWNCKTEEKQRRHGPTHNRSSLLSTRQSKIRTACPAMTYFIPISSRIFGLCSSIAKTLWQVSQSFGIVRPSAVA